MVLAKPGWLSLFLEAYQQMEGHITDSVHTRKSNNGESLRVVRPGGK